MGAAERFPTLLAVADALAVRYPDEIEGHLYSGLALLIAGDPAAALGPLFRVVAMDSRRLRERRDGPACGVCEAMQGILLAYQTLDSVTGTLDFVVPIHWIRCGDPARAGRMLRAVVESKPRRWRR